MLPTEYIIPLGFYKHYLTTLDRAVCRRADLLQTVVDADLEAVDEEDAEYDLKD